MRPARHRGYRFNRGGEGAAVIIRLPLNPDSAVPADAMSKKQTFRSEGNGSLPLSGHRSLVFKLKSKTYNGEVQSSEQDFETLQLGAFATPGLLLAQGRIGLTADRY